MKKIVSLALVFCLALGALAGCGSKNTAGTKKVVMWSHNSHAKTALVEIIDEFNKGREKEIGVEIELVMKENEMEKMLDLAFSSGQAPDIFTACNFQKQAEAGNLLDISTLPGMEKYIEKYDGQLAELRCKYQGVLYAIPTVATTSGVAYNKDLFKAAGIVDENGEAKAPKTLADIREYAKKLTDTSKRQYGIAYAMKYGGWFGSTIQSPSMVNCGYNGYNPVNGTFDYTNLKDTMQLVLDIKKDGSYYPGCETMENDTARALFAEGLIGMIYADSWDVGVFDTQFSTKIDWAVAPLPVADENAQAYKQVMGCGLSTYMNSKITDKITKEQAFEIFELLNGKEKQKKFYEKGIDIPYDSEVIKEADSSKLNPKFKQFAELVNISILPPVTIKYDIGTERNLATRFAEDVWTGKTTDLDKLLTDYSKIVNDGVKKYADAHPEYDGKSFLVENWDAKR